MQWIWLCRGWRHPLVWYKAPGLAPAAGSCLVVRRRSGLAASARGLAVLSHRQLRPAPSPSAHLAQVHALVPAEELALHLLDRDLAAGRGGRQWLEWLRGCVVACEAARACGQPRPRTRVRKNARRSPPQSGRLSGHLIAPSGHRPAAGAACEHRLGAERGPRCQEQQRRRRQHAPAPEARSRRRTRAAAARTSRPRRSPPRSSAG